MDRWFRFHPLHCASGERHMGLESEAFDAMERALREGRLDSEEARPLLRLYTWEVPTISLGRSQDPAEALAPRWEAWSRDPASDPLGPGAVVRRPTGGRAVWHEEELTYSVLMPREHPAAARAPGGFEQLLGEWLCEAGRNAGISDLALERGKLGRDPLGIGRAPCFASVSRMELTWKGLKWVGSARRLGQCAVLQHGAIRLGPAGDKLQAWLGGSGEDDPRPWQELPSIEALADALLQGFERIGAG